MDNRRSQNLGIAIELAWPPHIVGATPFVNSGWPLLLKWVQHLLILWPILLKWWPILLIRWPTLLIWNNKMGIFKFWVATFFVSVQNQQSLSFPNQESTILVKINLESTLLVAVCVVISCRTMCCFCCFRHHHLLILVYIRINNRYEDKSESTDGDSVTPCCQRNGSAVQNVDSRIDPNQQIVTLKTRETTNCMVEFLHTHQQVCW